MFAKNLASQLAEFFPQYEKALVEPMSNHTIQLNVEQHVEKAGSILGVNLGNINLHNTSPEDAFIQLVREPLEILYSKEPKKQIIIVVDALDEAVYNKESPNRILHPIYV